MTRHGVFSMKYVPYVIAALVGAAIVAVLVSRTDYLNGVLGLTAAS
jgi:hypothetical protein